MISICVPSYNSLEYLKIFHKGLKRNTKIEHELLIHDNGSTDGTEEWLKENNIKHTRSETNLGFAGVNNVLRKAKYEYTMIFNADMYTLPRWDTAIVEQMEKFKQNNIDKFTISCCLVEPTDNPEYSHFFAGFTANTFNEALLLGRFIKEENGYFKKEDTIQYSHPILFPTKMLQEMNYLDEDYFPGWAIDHNMAATAYRANCRNFIMLGGSRVYHFSSATFKKLPNDIRNRHGQDIFEKKWGMTVDEFRQKLGVKKPYGKVSDGIL